MHAILDQRRTAHGGEDRPDETGKASDKESVGLGAHFPATHLQAGAHEAAALLAQQPHRGRRRRLAVSPAAARGDLQVGHHQRQQPLQQRLAVAGLGATG